MIELKNVILKSCLVCFFLMSSNVFSQNVPPKGLVIEENKPQVLIYNAVTPNGDGVNDTFLIEGIEAYDSSVEIYNRWGVLVFETKNYAQNNNVFTGVSTGRVTLAQNEKLPTGTYYYIINVMKVSGNKNIQSTGYLYLNQPN